jgi:hypothetical protein
MCCDKERKVATAWGTDILRRPRRSAIRLLVGRMVVSGRALREALWKEHPPACRCPSDEVEETAREKRTSSVAQFVGDHGLHGVEDALQDQELGQTPHATAICERPVSHVIANRLKNMFACNYREIKFAMAANVKIVAQDPTRFLSETLTWCCEIELKVGKT